MVSRVATMVLALVAAPCCAQNLLQITSPPSGTVVYPGQVVTISVSADPSVSNIAIVAPHPLGFSAATNGQQLQFQLTIPSNTPIRPYNVSALGSASDGSLVTSPSISLQVDTQYSANINGTQPGILRFSAAGDIIPLHVIGTLPDGSQLDITHSVQTTYSSQNPQIATVDGQGIVTAVAPGTTYIVVTNNNSSYLVSTKVGQLAMLVFPALGSMLSGSSVNFQWTGSNTATAYRLDLGSTQGGTNYFQSGSLPTTTVSQTVSNLPTDGSTVYATLWTQINGQWANNQYYYTAFKATTAQITSPQKGSTLTGAAATFTWVPGNEGTGYELWVGSTPNSHDIDEGTGSYPFALQTSFSNLPTNGQTLYVTLYSYFEGAWVLQDTAQYLAATMP